jgi:hypothetical protein
LFSVILQHVCSQLVKVTSTFCDISLERKFDCDAKPTSPKHHVTSPWTFVSGNWHCHCTDWMHLKLQVLRRIEPNFWNGQTTATKNLWYRSCMINPTARLSSIWLNIFCLYMNLYPYGQTTATKIVWYGSLGVGMHVSFYLLFPYYLLWNLHVIPI